MSARRSALTISLAIGLLGVGGSARAQAPSEAEEAVRRGIELRRERRDEDALAEFRRAYALAPTPRVLAQQALAEEALGRWAAAEADLTLALRAKDDPWIARHLSTLTAALAASATHLGTLDVTTNVTGTKLRINGVVAGVLPQSGTRVEAGEVALEATSRDGTTIERAIHLAPGGAVRVEIVFDVGAHSASSALASPSAPAASPAAAPPLTEPNASASASQRTWGWITLGGAAAFLTAGVAAHVVRESHVAHYNDDAACDPAHRLAACGAERDAANQAFIFAAVGYGVAGALAIAGSVLLATAPPDRPPVRVGAWLEPRSFGASLGATF